VSEHPWDTTPGTDGTVLPTAELAVAADGTPSAVPAGQTLPTPPPAVVPAEPSAPADELPAAAAQPVVEEPAPEPAGAETPPLDEPVVESVAQPVADPGSAEAATRAKHELLVRAEAIAATPDADDSGKAPDDRALTERLRALDEAWRTTGLAGPAEGELRRRYQAARATYAAARSRRADSRAVDRARAAETKRALLVEAFALSQLAQGTTLAELAGRRLDDDVASVAPGAPAAARAGDDGAAAMPAGAAPGDVPLDTASDIASDTASDIGVTP